MNIGGVYFAELDGFGIFLDDTVYVVHIGTSVKCSIGLEIACINFDSIFCDIFDSLSKVPNILIEGLILKNTLIWLKVIFSCESIIQSIPWP